MKLRPAGVLLSPGPGRPDEARLGHDLLDRFAGEVPVLGVCLGHQVIAEHWGAVVTRAAELRHGETSPIRHDGEGVFAGLANPFTATRYHSLAVEPGSVRDPLAVTATSEDGTVMGLRHRSLDVEGVQFHPESILTEDGSALLANWLRRLEGPDRERLGRFLRRGGQGRAVRRRRSRVEAANGTGASPKLCAQAAPSAPSGTRGTAHDSRGLGSSPQRGRLRLRGRPAPARGRLAGVHRLRGRRRRGVRLHRRRLLVPRGQHRLGLGEHRDRLGGHRDRARTVGHGAAAHAGGARIRRRRCWSRSSRP